MSLARGLAVPGAAVLVFGIVVFARAGAVRARGGLGDTERAAHPERTEAAAPVGRGPGGGERSAPLGTGQPASGIPGGPAVSDPPREGLDAEGAPESGVRARTRGGARGRRDIGDDTLLAAAVARRQGWAEDDSRIAELAHWFAEEAGRPRAVLSELVGVTDPARRAALYNRIADEARAALVARFGSGPAAALARDVRLVRMDPATGAIRPVDASGGWVDG